jgi:hypothetical protein
MSFTYECDFNLQAQRLTPITKRQDVRLGLLESISEAIQWNRDNFFDKYLEGDSAAAWDVGTNYVRYDRVNYQNRIYECTNDIISELPTNTDYWVLVVSDFRGATERIKYNCQKIILEYILNKWFAAAFRQPSTGLDSDFYIVDSVRRADTMTAFNETTVSGVYVASNTFQSPTFTQQWVYEVPAYSSGVNFAVYYPLATIPTTTDDKYYQMVSLINKYKIFGSTVEYISY